MCNYRIRLLWELRLRRSKKENPFHLSVSFIQLDRRRGAVIAIDADKAKAYAEVKRALRIALAKGSLKNVSREEVHEMVDELFDEYGGKE